MLRFRLTQQFGLTQSCRVTPALALCLSLFSACGGNIIPIGGEPLDTDDSDTSSDTPTLDTTNANDSDDNQTSASDDSDDTSGGGDTSGNTPGGVYCAQYEPCGVDDPCKAGDCISFPECGSAICIPAEDACKLSCPDPEDCAILESYPEQLACAGKVPAIPGKPGSVDECTLEGGKCLPPGQSAPPSYTIANFQCTEPDYACWVLISSEPSEPIGGVSCEPHKPCDVNTACEQGETCLDFPEIGMALCISVEEACKFSCPDPASCVIAESYPGQLSCPNRIEATCSAGASTDDAGAPEGVKCEDHETCDALDPCDEGSCIKVPGCEKPLCIDAALACKQACGQVDCKIAESYPEQLFCNDDDEPGEDPDQPVSSNDAGASAPGFPGLDASASNDASSE